MKEVDPNGVPQHAAGAKLDAGKVDLSLLTLWPRALVEVCRVGSLGQSKYSRGGFLQVQNGVVRYTAALLRHLFKESAGQVYDDDPYYDTEAGAVWKNTIRHDAQVAWNALSRLELKLMEEEKNGKERSNRNAVAPGAVVALPKGITPAQWSGVPTYPEVSGQPGEVPQQVELGGVNCYIPPGAGYR